MSSKRSGTPSPALGHIHAIALYSVAIKAFSEIAESIAGSVPPDAANEQAVLIRDPLPTNYSWNGLVAVEKFGPDQVPHIHLPDPRKKDSSERYILLLPTAKDSSVFIAPPNAPHKGEKILFEQGNLYLLHFDGGFLHKFTNAYAIAFHTNDVATTPEALMEQTELRTTRLPQIPDETIFRSPRNLPFGYPREVHDLLQMTKTALAEGNKWGEAEHMVAHLAFHVITNGKAYGANRWSSTSTLREWSNTMIDRDLPGPQHVDRSNLQIGRSAPPTSNP